MTNPTLPNADELEVVAYWHECRNKNGQLWDWTVSQDAEMEFSTEHAPGSGEDYVSIAKPLVTLSSAQAQIERLTRERDEAQASLKVVQNAAKTLASCHGTELEHLRQNANYDHRLRAQHESLMDRDAQMTDALLAAEAEVKRLREALERISAVATNARHSQRLVSPYQDHREKRSIWVKARYEVGKSIFELCRSALSGGTSNG